MRKSILISSKFQFFQIPLFLQPHSHTPIIQRQVYSPFKDKHFPSNVNTFSEKA